MIMKPRFPGNDSRAPSAICPFCDHMVRSEERLVRCANCGEVFERELELYGDGPDPDFFS